MLTIRLVNKPVALLVSFAVMTMSLYMPAAQAAMVSTDQVIGVATFSTARIQLETALLRDDVQQALIAQGVNPQDVAARVAALSDAEAAQLATQLNDLPAGGDGLGG